MPRRTFNQMRYTFGEHLDIDSKYVAMHRFALLTEIEPVRYNCCINSCMCYTGKYKHDVRCRFCNEPRTRGGKPQRQFSYLPFIPHSRAGSKVKLRYSLCHIVQTSSTLQDALKMSSIPNIIGTFAIPKLSSMGMNRITAISIVLMTLPSPSVPMAICCSNAEERVRQPPHS